MAEHGRGAGRHAAAATAGTGTGTVEAAAPTAPFASAPPQPGTGTPTPRPAVAADDPGDAGDLGGRDELDDHQDLGAPVRGVGWVLLIGGLVGAVVSLVLTVEKLDLLENPNYIPSCSIDPVLSCGTVMKTWQASVVGFPNPLVGLLAFPAVAACGAVVVSRVELPRWVWLALQVGSFAGVLFIHWLIVQSLVVIHALCPYCMVAWAATIAIFWFTTVHNLREGNLGGAPAGETLARRHGWGLAAWYLLVVVAIVASFPAYFGAMVGLG